MGRWVLAVFGATALVAVVSASAQVVSGRTAFRSAALSAGATKSLTVSCPAGYYAVSAGTATAGAGISQLEVRPVSLRKVAFRLANGGDLQRATVAAACRSVGTPGTSAPHLKLSPPRHVTVTVAATSQRQARFTCPKGTLPSAAGFDLGRGDVSVRRQTQDLHVLTFAAFNHGNAARKVSFYGSCLTVVHPTGARGAKLQVSLATETVPVPSGSQVETRVCPRGWLSLAVGYSLPAGLDLNGAAAIGGTGRWSLTNPGGKPLLAQLQLACARLS